MAVVLNNKMRISVIAKVWKLRLNFWLQTSVFAKFGSAQW